MEDERFDALAKGIGLHSSRRTMLKGVLGITGGVTGLTLNRTEVDAIQSSHLCVPDRDGSYHLRLVPSVSVGRYRQQYQAILPNNENGCPPCQQGFSLRDGFCSHDLDD